MLPYLRLCRLPTLFTALSNILAGFLLSHAGLTAPQELLLLMASSAGLYLSGMVFNDVFDIRQDSQERPGRPIPSGQISRGKAVIFAVTLMIAGLVCAALAGRVSLMLAAVLAVLILLYDSFLKRTPLGPLNMGLCRAFNLLLGASSVSARLAGPFQQPLLWYAVCIGIYITGVTMFAKREALLNKKLPLIIAMVVINFGLSGIAFWFGNLSLHFGFLIPPGALARPETIFILWGVIVLTVNRRLWAAISDPSPAKIQPAIGVMLLTLIVLDAMVIYFKMGTAGIPLAVACVALIVPAMLMRRVIPMT